MVGGMGDGIGIRSGVGGHAHGDVGRLAICGGGGGGGLVEGRGRGGVWAAVDGVGVVHHVGRGGGARIGLEVGGEAGGGGVLRLVADVGDAGR